MLEREYEKNRAAFLRAGLVAATIVNVNRKKGRRAMRPDEFIREPRRESDYMSIEEAAAHMNKWAADLNREKESPR